MRQPMTLLDRYCRKRSVSMLTKVGSPIPFVPGDPFFQTTPNANDEHVRAFCDCLGGVKGSYVSVAPARWAEAGMCRQNVTEQDRPARRSSRPRLGDLGEQASSDGRIPCRLGLSRRRDDRHHARCGRRGPGPFRGRRAIRRGLRLEQAPSEPGHAHDRSGGPRHGVARHRRASPLQRAYEERRAAKKRLGTRRPSCRYRISRSQWTN